MFSTNMNILLSSTTMNILLSFFHLLYV